jgi:NADH-quinone oxidoreductase subunit G
MGQTGRGEDAEITSYLGETLDSEPAGQHHRPVPGGRAGLKPYAFTARPWELTKTETIDVMDALGSNIRVDTKGREVMRILPRNHDGVNEEWISDKTRFVWDGLRRQRLDKPYIRENGKLRPATWPEALGAARRRSRARKARGPGGRSGPGRGGLALKQLIEGQGGAWNAAPMARSCPRATARPMSARRDRGYRHAKAILLIGTNPAVEAPVLNARIRKAWLKGGAEVTA